MVRVGSLCGCGQRQFLISSYSNYLYSRGGISRLCGVGEVNGVAVGQATVGNGVTGTMDKSGGGVGQENQFASLIF